MRMHPIKWAYNLKIVKKCVFSIPLVYFPKTPFQSEVTEQKYLFPLKENTFAIISCII